MEIRSVSTVQNNLYSNTKKNDEPNEQPQQTGKGAKKLVLALAGLAVLSTAGMAIAKNNEQINSATKPIDTKIQDEDFKMQQEALKVDFIIPTAVSIDTQVMKKPFEIALNKLSVLEKTDKQYSWVNLPQKLIDEKYIDSVYKTVAEFKAQIASNNPQLIFVALGNPANADELVNALGVGQNVTYACDITPTQIKDTVKKAGGNLENIQVLISSKSGSTFESNQTYKLLNAEFTQYYKNKGVAQDEIQSKVSKHFLLLTDRNPEKSTLKRKAEEQGIKTIDCVDDLHSAFGDIAYSMPLLAYAGLLKSDANKMLDSANKMSKKLSSDSFSHNAAAQIAAFDKLAKDSGATKEQFIFHDSHFCNFSNIVEQIYKESLRELDFTTSVYPRSAHSGLEVDISRNLKNQPISIITNVDVVNTTKQTPVEDKYFEEAAILRKAHQLNAQKEGHFQKNITLKLDSNGVSPESLGEFVTLKSYVAYFKNEFEHMGKINMFNQSYVKEYKDIRIDLEKNNK